MLEPCLLSGGGRGDEWGGGESDTPLLSMGVRNSYSFKFVMTFL